MDADEAEKALDLRVTEVPVFGEPPLTEEFIDRPLRQAFSLAGRLNTVLDFGHAYARFQDLHERFSGEPFKRFDEGVIAANEGYKPRLRELALTRLEAGSWAEEDIGSGKFVDLTIEAIEIQASIGDLTNNLVFWQNRFGHANRDHRTLIEAKASRNELKKIEGLLFKVFRSSAEEGAVFDELKDALGGKYPLLAYLFFLKDMNRFMPIQPTGFDRAFEAIGIDLRTRGNCSWKNYSAFNQAIEDIRQAIEVETSLKDVRLVDAHSLIWLFSNLIKKEAAGELEGGHRATERVLGAKERSIADIKYSVGRTVFTSNGQTVERKVKDKELRMTDYELDRLLRHLLEVQQESCAITGLPFQYQGAHTDSNMLPSLDRIDSDGHYENGNLQLVCRFINFWKQAADDQEFRRLINVVRRIE